MLAFLFLNLVFSYHSTAQNIAITDDDSYTAQSSAMLDVKSNTKGLLIPRLTTAVRTAMASPATGLLVFDSDLKAFYYHDGSAWVNLSRGQVWSVNSNYVFLSDINDKVGIGTSTPNSKLEVKVDSSFTVDDTLFVVKDKDGYPVFAVFPYGAKVYVNETTKGNISGFAVSGRTSSKGDVNDYLFVSPDSTRVYVNEDSTKGNIGGFAVSGRTTAKGITNSYMEVTRDSTRIYINEDITKGNIGGFAVSGRTSSKAATTKFMDMTSKNYLIGQEAGLSLTTGLYNSFMGYQAGKLTTEGSSNVFLGYQTGDSTTTGGDNVFIGTHAGASNKDGYRNIFLGSYSGYSAASSDNSVYIGFESGLNSTSANGNVLVGAFTGRELGVGGSNTIVGCYAGYHGSGVANSIFGLSAGESSTGNYNCFFGANSGIDNTGTQNCFYGNYSGYVNQGSNNTFLGYQSGQYNRPGSNNVFIGMKSGYGTMAGSTGNYNVYIGVEAGLMDNKSTNNVFIGYRSGAYNSYLAATTDQGSYNTFIGDKSGFSNKRGSYNTVLGNSAGYLMNYGSGNVFIGNRAGYSIYDGANNVFIGDSAGYSETGSNRLYIDNSPTTSPLIYGDFENNSIVINGNLSDNSLGYHLYVNGRAGGDYVWNSLSDLRLKKNINTINGALGKVMELRGVNFEWKDTNSPEKGLRIGFIAQEVEKIIPEVINREGEFYSMQYEPITALLVEAIKEQQKQIEELKEKNKEIAALKAELETLKQMITQPEK